MRFILKFILWKLKGADFWLLCLGSLAMYMGWQTRTQMRERIWKSYSPGQIHKGVKF